MIYAISDLHLPSTSGKTMDKFGWDDHISKLKNNWELNDDDTIIIAGDISWALKQQEIIPDLDFLSSLKGKKIFVKGNHDLWWNSTKKINELLLNYPDISYIHNSSQNVENISICGTRGWDIKAETSDDEKILKREVMRLVTSITSANSERKIVFMHYPPLLKSKPKSEFENIFKKYDIKEVYYGHLHGDAINDAIQGEYNGIYYKCIACDQLNFKPILLS